MERTFPHVSQNLLALLVAKAGGESGPQLRRSPSDHDRGAKIPAAEPLSTEEQLTVQLISAWTLWLGYFHVYSRKGDAEPCRDDGLSDVQSFLDEAPVCQSNTCQCEPEMHDTMCSADVPWPAGVSLTRTGQTRRRIVTRARLPNGQC